MIPILYRGDEKLFTSNGHGRLTDCISCTVTEERNGIYELEFQYPITGKYYDYMVNYGGIVGAIHDDRHDIQLFDIYAHKDPIDGVVTFNAHHVSYRLANVIVSPFSGNSAGDTLTKIPTKAMTECPFTFWTNKATGGDFELKTPDNVRAILCGQQGSILDVYGTGDYEFDNFQVKLYANRGVDTGVTIRYGKNMSDIENHEDDSRSYSAIVPYWAGGEGNAVYGNPVISATLRGQKFPWNKDNSYTFEIADGHGEVIEFRTPIITPKAVDFTSDFSEQPTTTQLEDRARAYMAANETWEKYRNVKVDFVQLWQTPEYENVASLQRVSMCDKVSVYYPEMGITQNQQKVIRVVYNVLLERYDSIELGQAKTTLSELFETDLGFIDLRFAQETNALEQLVQHQTELIQGGLGGYVVMKPNSLGQPQEILIMDTDDIDTAVNVIRMNKNGIGFSQNGYAGPFNSAWTIGGVFNANFIGAGSMLANYIKGGTLSLGGYDNINGVFTVNDANGDTVTNIDKDGISTNSLVASEYIRVDGNEYSYFKIPAGVSTSEYVEMSRLGYIINGSIGRSLFYGNTAGLDNRSLEDPDNQIMIDYDSIYIKDSNYACSIEPELIELGLIGTTTPYSSIEYDLIKTPEIRVTGNKSRQVKTEDFGERLLYCYETPSPLFGDVGEGRIDDEGVCYVSIDPVFSETISVNNYQVFLQKYGDGDCWVSERHAGYFVVSGSPGLSFGWELKAKQADFDQLRIEKADMFEKIKSHDYGLDGANYYKKLMEERESA